MAEQQLKVKIGADVGGAVAGFKQVATAANALPNALNRTQTATRTATFAFTNMGRVVQDLPFGPAGIANNIEGVALSLKSLKEAAKSSGQSIGSVLLKSLTGSGGLLIGISLVSAALSIASFGMGSWTRMFGGANAKAKEHANALKEAKEAIEKYVESLNDVEKARIKGAQSAQGEIVQLRTLYQATQNANIPIAERRKLVDELQDQYPKYFANIKDEVILAGGAEKAYNSLASAILAAAKARAGQDAITELAKEQLVLEEQRAKALIEQDKAATKLLKTQQDLNKPSNAPISSGGLPGAGGGGFQKPSRQVDLSVAQQVYNSKLKETFAIHKKINENLERQQKLADSITSTVEGNANALLDPTGSLPKGKEGKKAELDFHFIVPVRNIEFPSVDEISKAATRLGLKLTAPLDIPVRVNIAPEINSAAAIEETDKMFRKLIEVQEFVSGQLTPAFQGMFSEILNGGNVFDSLTKAIGDTVKKLVAQLAAMAAVAGVLSLLGGGSFSSLFLKGTKKMFGFSKGGFVPGAGNKDTVPAMLTPGELVIPKSLVKQLTNRGSSSSLGGGLQFPEYIAMQELRGDMLRMWLAKSNHNHKLYG